MHSQNYLSYAQQNSNSLRQNNDGIKIASPSPNDATARSLSLASIDQGNWVTCNALIAPRLSQRKNLRVQTVDSVLRWHVGPTSRPGEPGALHWNF